MTPKTFSRVLRFERAATLLVDGVPSAQVSAICGLSDQPHLNRAFRALAGRAPAAFAASVMNFQDGVGIAA